jgi:hypothetical protein
MSRDFVSHFFFLPAGPGNEKHRVASQPAKGLRLVLRHDLWHALAQ